MADGTVGILQSGTPDRLIDNDYLDPTTTPGVTGTPSVYRQRVEDPELMAVLRELVDVLSWLGQARGVNGDLRVVLGSAGSAVSTINAVTTVTTVTTVSNQTSMGGVAGQYLYNEQAMLLRNTGIVVS